MFMCFVLQKILLFGSPELKKQFKIKHFRTVLKAFVVVVFVVVRAQR